MERNMTGVQCERSAPHTGCYIT